MLNTADVLTILSMALVTYLTRILGYWALRNRTMGPRMTKVFEAVPGCVLICVIAPVFATARPANLIALGVTILAATRFSILPTVVAGIGSAALLRHYL